MRKILTLIIVSSILVSCSKDNTDNTNSNLTATNFNQLNVNADFNWISGTESSITVEVLQPSEFPLNLENQQIWVRNSAGKRIAFSSLNSNLRAQFQLVIPDNHDAYEFYLPATNESWQIQWKSTQTLQLKDPLDASSFKGKQRGKTNFRSKTIQANNLLGNADFETTISPSNVNVSSFSPITSPVDDGQWRVSNNLFSQISQGGSTVIAPGNGVNYMWQNITVNPGDSVIFDADYQGNVIVYLWFWNYDGSSAGLRAYTANSLNAVPNGLKAVVPNNANVVTALILFGSGSVSSGDYFDNAYLGIPSAVADSDNDGIADDVDEYPNDPSRAFTSY